MQSWGLLNTESQGQIIPEHRGKSPGEISTKKSLLESNESDSSTTRKPLCVRQQMDTAFSVIETKDLEKMTAMVGLV